MDHRDSCSVCGTAYALQHQIIRDCPCGSQWCRYCLQEAFIASLTGSLPRCACGAHINYHEHIHHFTASFLNEFDDRLAMRAATSPMYCANSECGLFLVDIARAEFEMDWVKCRDCEQETCPKCKNLKVHHEANGCPANTTEAAAIEILAGAQENGLDLSRCQCGHIIERAEGCPHMSCTHCGYEYCVYCSEPWPCQCGQNEEDYDEDYYDQETQQDNGDWNSDGADGDHHDTFVYHDHYPQQHHLPLGYGWNPDPTWTEEDLEREEQRVIHARIERRRRNYEARQQQLDPESNEFLTDEWIFPDEARLQQLDREVNNFPRHYWHFEHGLQRVGEPLYIPENLPRRCNVRNIDLNQDHPGFAPAEGGNDEDFQSYMEVLGERGQRTETIACPHDNGFAHDHTGGRCEGHCGHYLPYYLNQCRLCGMRVCDWCQGGRRFHSTEPAPRDPTPGWVMAGRNAILGLVLWTMGSVLIDQINSQLV